MHSMPGNGTYKFYSNWLMLSIPLNFHTFTMNFRLLCLFNITHCYSAPPFQLHTMDYHKICIPIKRLHTFIVMCILCVIQLTPYVTHAISSRGINNQWKRRVWKKRNGAKKAREKNRTRRQIKLNGKSSESSGNYEHVCI